MFMQPFSNLNGKQQSKACEIVTNYREELRKADNRAADKNPQADTVEVAYDSTTLTARLLPNRAFETRYQGAEGVSVNIVEQQICFGSSLVATITSVSRSTQGTYEGSRASAHSISTAAVSASVLDKEEAEFLFNMREPGLRPAKAALSNK